MTDTAISYREKWAEQERCQEAINAVFAEQGPIAAELAIRLRIQTDLADYRQYDGYHDEGWELGIATERFRSKGGVQVEQGDVVLCKRDRPWAGCSPHHTFYSVRLGWHCSYSYGIRPLDRSR